MKKIIYSIAIITVVFTMTSCNEEVCIKCVKYDKTDSTEMCSPTKAERNEFIVSWTQLDYNCSQIEN